MAKRRKPLFARIPLHPAVVKAAARLRASLRGPVERVFGPLTGRLRKLGLIESVTSFVLTIGDEGATLVQLQAGEVVDAVFVGPETEDGLGVLRGYLARDPRARLTVAADVLEQMYREEQLPKVGRFDRANVTKRRLDIAFPQDRLKDSLPQSGGKVLFASLPETEAIRLWIEFLESLTNPVIGFCLMPLESAGIPIELGPPVLGDGGQAWRVMVTQQATSGFRQIFETEDRMLVTRLAQRPPTELSAQAIAQLIERELRSSISYVKRLGYSDQDRLDLIVLAEPEVCRAVEERDLPISSLTAYTPYQAGLLLGLGEVAPEDSGLSDVLHARWLAAKRKPMMVLSTEPLRDRLLFDRVFKIGLATAVALSLFAISDLVSLSMDAFDTTTTADLLVQQLATERQAIDVTKSKLASLDVSLEDVLLVDNTADKIAKSAVDIEELLQRVAGALTPGELVQKAVFRIPSLATGDAAAPAAAVAAPPKPVRGRAAPVKADDLAYELSVVVQFDPNPSVGRSALEQAKELQDRLGKLFPDHAVSAVKVPTNSLRKEVIENIPNEGARQAGAMQTAEYLIQKRG